MLKTQAGPLIVITQVIACISIFHQRFIHMQNMINKYLSYQCTCIGSNSKCMQGLLVSFHVFTFQASVYIRGSSWLGNTQSMWLSKVMLGSPYIITRSIYMISWVKCTQIYLWEDDVCGFCTLPNMTPSQNVITEKILEEENDVGMLLTDVQRWRNKACM